MIAELVVALGLVAVLEGLFLILAPRRWENLLRRLAEIPYDQRRFVGLVAIAFGVALVWFSRSLL